MTEPLIPDPAMESVASVGALLAAAAVRLRSAGVASPEVDSRWLLAEVLGVSPGGLILASRPSAGPPSADQCTAFEGLVRRREQREPLQHLLGRAAFRHLDLRVGPGVFVPRPETELLLDLVRPRLTPVDHPVVVDVCAGSGALGLSAAMEFRAGAVALVERSPAALAWLRRNVADLHGGTGVRLTVVPADVRDPGLTEPGGDLYPWVAATDVVLCNPPYVPTRTPVGPEVHYDPAEAVFAGADGMDLIPPVLALAGRLLAEGGVLGIEHDETRQAQVRLSFGAGWREVTGHADLTGRPRFVTAVRSR